MGSEGAASRGADAAAGRLEVKLLKKGPKLLKASRWEHSLRTADYAVFMAERYGADPVSCRLASLAHDLARGKKPAKQELWARRDLGEIPSFMAGAPQLLHGPASAWYLEHRLGCRDGSVLNAVRYHTTGHPELDEAGLIVFAADFMEPGRIHLNDGERERLLGFDLPGLVMEILESMEKHLEGKGIVPSPWSRELYSALKKR